MKFLVDAQLPARLAWFLADAGHDAVHTSELPEGNRTTDARITALADRDDRVVVTKDRDFATAMCSPDRPGGGSSSPPATSPTPHR